MGDATYGRWNRQMEFRIGDGPPSGRFDRFIAVRGRTGSIGGAIGMPRGKESR
jgi:hypothetical protein